MKLINYTNYQIQIADEALLVKSIRDLFNKDKSKDKELFLQQCSVIYFMEDPRSTYSDIIDKEDRFKEILKREGIKITMNKELLKAMEDYSSLCETTSSKLLQDTKIAVTKVRLFLKDVDLNEVDDKGKPVYTVNTITTAIKQIPLLAKDLVETEKIVNKEIEEQGRMRGSDKNAALFENGF